MEFGFVRGGMSTVKGHDAVDETCVSTKKARLSPAIDKWNGRPYSQKYYEILEKRKTLPVWNQREEIFEALKANQSLILVGETGSSKTTQVRDDGGSADFYCDDDILIEILLRLPLKSVFRCKCVSKRWYSLISDHIFHKIYSTYPRESNLLGFFQAPFMIATCCHRSLKKLSLQFLATSPPDGGDIIRLESSQKIINSLGYIICSSDGLLLCGIDPCVYNIFNPITKECHRLPPPPRLNCHCTIKIITGFVVASGANISSIRYKVVYIENHYYNIEERKSIEISTFSSKTGKWKQSMVPITGTSSTISSRSLNTFKKTIVIRGIIHWLGYDIGMYDPYMVDGYMKIISRPSTHIRDYIIGESTDGLLQMAMFNEAFTSIKVWVFDSDKDQWTLRYRLPLLEDPQLPSSVRCRVRLYGVELVGFHPHNPEAVFINFDGYIYRYHLNITPRMERIWYHGGRVFRGGIQTFLHLYFLPCWPISPHPNTKKNIDCPKP